MVVETEASARSLNVKLVALYILGFFTGIFTTLTVTILVGWLINKFGYSSWLNRAFYGYALGCYPISSGKDVG